MTSRAEKEAEILAELPEEERVKAVAVNRAGEAIRRESYNKYVLVDNIPVPVGLGTWAAWFEVESKKPDGGKRRVAETTLEHPGIGPVWISTVFLGLDHSFGRGPRLLFETMVCWRHGSENKTWDNQWRYPTWDTAVAGHAKAIAWVQAYLENKVTREELDEH